MSSREADRVGAWKDWVRLYFDVETLREENEDAFINERVIAIGVIEDRSEYSEESLREGCGSASADCEVRLFTEWELGSEKAVVDEFYKYVKEIHSRHVAVFVGFGVLRFDIPLLIQKAVEHGVCNLAECNKFWHDVRVRDLFQVLLPLNAMKFKGLKLATVAQWLKAIHPEAPEPYGEGSNIYYLYMEKRYDEIEKHLAADLQIVRWIDLAVLTRFKNEETRIRLFETFGFSTEASPRGVEATA